MCPQLMDDVKYKVSGKKVGKRGERGLGGILERGCEGTRLGRKREREH